MSVQVLSSGAYEMCAWTQHNTFVDNHSESTTPKLTIISDKRRPSDNSDINVFNVSYYLQPIPQDKANSAFRFTSTPSTPRHLPSAKFHFVNRRLQRLQHVVRARIQTTISQIVSQRNPETTPHIGLRLGFPLRHLVPV